MRGSARLVLAVLALTCGCFSPAFEDGQFTCPSGECPPGLACVDGLCVRDPSGPTFDASAIDAPATADDAATTPDGATADAGAPQPARVYFFAIATGIWTHEPAGLYFGGVGAPEPAAVQTAWAHCAVGTTLCVGTDAGWFCTADLGTTWFANTWGYLDDLLKDAPPTYSTAWDVSGDFLKDVVFNAGPLWWKYNYFGRPRPDASGDGLWNLTLEIWHGAAGSADRDDQWADELNAPPSAAAITADFRTGGDWTLWTGDGTEYRRDATGWVEPGPAPYLSAAGAPPADLILAAAECAGVLTVVTRASP